MRTFIGLLILATLCITSRAQTPEPKVLNGLGARTEKIVKNAPFSADAISESVQTLADGNRIVHSSTSKLYRNSEGRFRREVANGSGGILGTYYSYGPGVTILDPVLGYKLSLDEKLKTARQEALQASIVKLNTGAVAAVDIAKMKAEAAALTDEQKAIADKKLAELKSLAAPRAATGGVEGKTINGPDAVAIVGVGDSAAYAVGYAVGSKSKYESRTEQLGIENIEGIDAEGTRTTTTIPAGAIGNERPIEIIYERWFSKDLQLVIKSKTSDPRSGEQTYRLTNIVRSEPDPSLFALPAGYKVIPQPTSVYRVSVAPKVESVKAVPVLTTVKAAPAPAAAKAKPQ